MNILRDLIQRVMAYDLSSKDIKLKAMNLFSINEREASLVIIHAKNERNKQKVAAAKKKLAFVPHCIRSAPRLLAGNCKAVFDPDGYHCRGCEATCQAKRLTESLKIPLYIVPGSTMLFRIIQRERPGAIIGFGCIKEIEEGLEACEKVGIPALGVPLMNDGCFNTMLNFDDASELLSEVGVWKNEAAKR